METVKHQDVHIKLLSKIKIAILQGDVDKLKALNNSIAIKKVDLEKCLKSERNPFESTNAVILACKEKQVKILEYLLSSQSKIIENSSGIILPTHEDETHHNAFYYAIRSGHSELIQMLISKWPGNFFKTHHQELEKIISNAYEELKMNNVDLTNEVKFLIEQHLIDLRFNATNMQRSNKVDDFVRNIKERVTLVTENVNLLSEKYSSVEEIDEEFLYVMKFVVQNINVLKQKLKSTYDRLPWEEIEFCLIIFIYSHCKKQEINIYCNAFLEDHKILSHLDNFIKKLESETKNLNALSIANLTAPIKQKRSIIVGKIINSCPEFKSLYDDYQQIRDLHSLMKISEILKLGLNANIKEKEGKIVIARILQVFGEYMKNTLESPNLSDFTNELLLAALPKNTRKVILRLRDSISHIDSVFKRSDIENNKEDDFFHHILVDLKGIGSVANDILEARKQNIISSLSNKIQTAETLDDYEKIKKMFKDNVKIDYLSDTFDNLVNNRVEELVDKLNDRIPDKTDYEKQLFEQIYNEYSRPHQDHFLDTRMRFNIFMRVIKSYGSKKFTVSCLRDLKNSKLIEINSKITEPLEPLNCQKIADLVFSIYKSVEARSVEAYVDDVGRITRHIMGMLSNANVNSIQDLEYKLKENEISKTPFKNAKSFTLENYQTELSNKQKELKCILNKIPRKNQQLFDCFDVYKEDEQMRAAVEMLVLDIMSIIAALKMNVGVDFLFVDDVSPVLVGKCLRNHLAHYNDLVTLLLDDPDRVIFLNAVKLSRTELTGNKKKRIASIGESIPSLRQRHDNSLKVLNIKRLMFVACEGENIDDLMSCIQKGADVKSRCRKGNGVLHFASKGGSITVLQFLLDMDPDLSVTIKELKVATLNGRTNLVKFIVQKIGIPVSDIRAGKSTLLHIAAENGHKDVVEFLIKNNCDPKKYDFQGLPIHYAAQQNHKHVVEALLKNGRNDIDDRNIGGFSLLHIAADFGYNELVEYLLKLGADVNAQTDKDNSTPLHLAAIHGHFEVVKMLVSKGANVNARILNGFPAIYYAADNNYVKIVSFLLENGANVNAAAIMCKYTSLHTACEKGYTNIVKCLLEKGADINLCNTNGLTPMDLAVKAGHTEIFTILLAYGSDIDAKKNDHNTLLHFAAKCGQTEIANKLIDHKLDVNARNLENITPLHTAAFFGNADMVNLLINHGASVELQTKTGDYPLHIAAFNNHRKVIEKLIQRGVQLDVKNYSGLTPLCLAIMQNHDDAIAVLIEHGATIFDNECFIEPLKIAIMKGNLNLIKLIVSNCNVEHQCLWSDAINFAVAFDQTEIFDLLIKSGVNFNKSKDGSKLLKGAVRRNNPKIVQRLLENGAMAIDKSIDPLLFEAVKLGHADVADILLKNYACVDKLFDNGIPLLFQAVLSGYDRIFKSIIAKCEDVNVVSSEGSTALHVAALLGRKEIIEILLDKGAYINFEGEDGTALHLAAGQNDDPKIVELLLSRGADVNIEDKKKRTALQMAVAKNKIETVKVFLSGISKKQINLTGTVDGVTLLHIAAQRGNMDIVKYLIDQGADINIKNKHGSKPIHHAAREGFIEIVKYFLTKGSSLNETGYDERTLLHYATLKGHTKVVKYLISENANLNAQTTTGLTPLHYSVLFGFKEVAKVLLDNGAVYNVPDKRNKKPVDMVENQKFYISKNFFQDFKGYNIASAVEQNEIVALLRSTDNLFKGVKRNNLYEVTKSIKDGAVLNAKDIKDNMLLHYVAWKGNIEIAEVLLNSKANVNASVKDGSTPLHYAAKFSHINIVKVLLSNGAIYNPINDAKSTPLHLATEKPIKDLLKIIDDLFKYVGYGNKRILTELEKITDPGILKAIVNARNENNKTISMVGKLCDFPKMKELTKILIGDMSSYMDKAYKLSIQEQYDEAKKIYEFVLEELRIKLGPNNFCLLDVKNKISTVLYKQNKYNEALDMLTEVYNLQKEFVGPDSKDALETRASIGLILHRLGKNVESLEIYDDVYQKQKKLLKPNCEELLSTQLHMALVLHHLGRFEDALKLNTENYEVQKKTRGEMDPVTTYARNNMAMVLSAMNKHDEAIQIFEEVYFMRQKSLGPFHSDTLRPLHNIAAVYMAKQRYEDAIKRYELVFEIQKSAFGLQHRDTLNTQFNLGKALFLQGKRIPAFKILKEYIKNAKPILGDVHPDILGAQSFAETINTFLKVDDSQEILAHLEYMQRNLNNAANEGTDRTVIDLINNGVNVNYVDENGRGALYYAVYSGHMKIVKILLENSANVYEVTNKGNTLFHAAASKGYEEILEFLLQYAEGEKQNKITEIINTRTATTGSTPLHVAAKNGSYEIVKSLLKRGAIFNIKNNGGLIPSAVSQNRDIIRLLTFVQDIFFYALTGDEKHIKMKLKSGNSDEVGAAIKARNVQCKTLLQVVLINCERKVALQLVGLLKADVKTMNKTGV